MPDSTDDLKSMVRALRKEAADRRVKLNEFEAAADKERKEREEKARKEAEAQGDFKKLLETEQAKTAKLQADMAQLQRERDLAAVVKEFELPDTAVKFITGATLDEMKAAAKELQTLVAVKPGTGNNGKTDGERGKGGGAGGNGTKPSQQEIAKQKAQSGRYSM